MKKSFLLKVKAGSILLMFMLAFFVTNIQPVKAETMELLSTPIELLGTVPIVIPSFPVLDASALAQNTQKNIKETLLTKIAKVLKTVGAKLVGGAVRNTLNRLALDAAKMVATSGEGQKPTYVISELGGYWKNLGDAAAGDFIDSLGEDWGVDLCTPPSPNIQAKISLGLVQTIAPTAPDCTITKLVSNYSSAYEKYEAMKSGDYLRAIQVNFEPTGSELGGAFTLFGRTFATNTKTAETEKDKTLVNKGWLDVRNIAGKLEGAPDTAKDALKTAKDIKAQSLLTTTGDVLVDAANIFLNQLAYESFQRVLRELNKGKSDGVESFDASKLKISGYESLIQYGETVVNEKLTSVIKPRFDVRSDYSIVTDLASCVDKENPGPTSCVIDDKFSQAISENLTVGEALAKGYLHGDWLVSGDNKSESTYTLRSASILRKYRIVSVGWEQAISEAIKNGYTTTFQDLVSCFDGNGPFSTNFNKSNQVWCRGLIDPNWVLKAPLNFCSKQGYGNQILSNLGISSVSRAGDYCADDQTCIKEKVDGSCEVYGHCNEEKRTWKFGTDSCEPVYNTCQTFTSSSDKQVASFLENTLDYSTCNQNNSGCKQYSYSGKYSAVDNTIEWLASSSIFFNSKIKACNSLNEGCTELLRGKPGWAEVNYIMNADFRLNKVDDTSTSTNWFWPIKDGTGKIVLLNGEKALEINGQNSATLYSDSTKSLLPKNFAPLSGWSYTLSADIQINSGNKVTMTFGGETKEVSGAGLQNISITKTDIGVMDFKISGSGSTSFVIKNLNLTPNNYNPGFSNYANFPVYEKLLPSYLEATCYNNNGSDYTFKDNAPSVCNNFARKCNLTEVGCEMFTSVKDAFSVAAKANSNNYCDASCVGYDTYIAKESYFHETASEYIIPEKSNSCTAEGVGCSSFTNLDDVSSGGEKIEYYTKIRQCIKPDTTLCGDFYTWDNSQLKVMSLKKDSSGNPDTVNKDLNSSCTKETYNLPVSDPKFNSDCREFYSKSGVITYRLISNTISCSDNCYSYRLNEKVEGNNCKNNGVWSEAQKACIYKTVPNEGKACVAEEVGCREYNGNNGNSLRIKAAYDFENGTSGFTGAISQSSESTVKGGHSLSVSGEAKVDASSFAIEDSAYIVKFIAKASTDSIIKIYFVNSDNEKAFFATKDNNSNGEIKIKGGNNWGIYEINIGKLDHKTKSESLVVESTQGIYLDNFIVNQITNKYYLIKGTSQVPDVCNFDLTDKYVGPTYNLGCAAYTDRSKTVHNLIGFSELCQNSAVGCEQMIQTNNSSAYYDYTVNLNSSDRKLACNTKDPNCVEVKGAQVVYAVFDPKKQCNSADAGCSRFGYFKTEGNTSSWVDNYKVTKPDSYLDEFTSPLCRNNEVGCDTWVTKKGVSSYFKNPGINACIFKNGAWIKMPVKRCDSNNNGKIDQEQNENNNPICFKDSDCVNKKCITDTNNYLCEIGFEETFGIGGEGNQVPTPAKSVGLCTAEASGCTEYIDPASKYVENLISNPTAEGINKNDVDKWDLTNSGYYGQKIKIKPNKLYILQLEGENVNNQVAVLDNFSTSTRDMEKPISSSGTFVGRNVVQLLESDNYLSATTTAMVSTRSSILFHSGKNVYVEVYSNFPSTNRATVSLKEAIINYQLKDDIDLTSCNGVVNTEAGCVLFNTRTQVGASGLKSNIFNASLTTITGAPVACDSAKDNLCIQNANSVIKVSPDRICSRWLDCQTFTEDPITKEKTCYKVGECDKLNEDNECGNFLNKATSTLLVSTENKNVTGYSLLNKWYLGSMKEVGLNTEAHFDFENTSVNLSCRRDVGDASNKLSCNFDKNINDSLVLSPEKTTTNYPAHGKGFLKVLNYYQISPQSDNSSISIYTNQDYYINYLVNTKGSSAKARLLITNNATTSPKVLKNGKEDAKFDDEAPNGWERKVKKFNISNFNINDPAKKPINIKIYLTSDATDLTAGYVYFDDINIEPVLQTGDNSYVSKDCRLYPSDDSSTCLSVNNNVIKDGLYGYCLAYDPLNPGVCLMWYPIDKISPITRNNQSNLGYSGKFPLYYCTEANGNFKLVEKRVGVFHAWADSEQDGTKNDNENDWRWIRETFKIDPISNISCSGVGINTIGDCECLDQTQSLKLCSDKNYTAVYARETIDNGVNDEVFVLYCIPNQNYTKNGVKITNLLVKSQEKTVALTKHVIVEVKTENKMSCRITFDEGWGVYDGFATSSFKTEVRTSTGADIEYDKESLVDIKEANNTIGTEFASVMVLEDGNSLESNLKYVSGSNLDQIFRFSCNKFSKFVENDGTNMAWSGRIGRSSIYSTTTPNFFNASFTGLNLFGRNREDVPFGAANLTSDYNLSISEPLLLRNQYSKQLNETLFAGRPYGCAGDGCSNIGQCSMNPNVFCIFRLGDTELNKKGCSAGGNGTCVNLWRVKPSDTLPTETNAISVLNQIFMNKYGDFVYSQSSGGYVGTNSSYFKFAKNTNSITPPHTVTNVGGIGYVKPVIENEKIYKYPNEPLTISNGKINVPYAGLYKLSFNVKIDAEQQPMKQIIINWGDSIQVVTGIDNKPEANTPHEFYHFYLKNNYSLEIKAIDNWEKYDCRSTTASGWSTNNSCSLN